MNVQKFTDKAIFFLIIVVPCMRDGFPIYFQCVLCYIVRQIKTCFSVIVLKTPKGKAEVGKTIRSICLDFDPLCDRV